MANNQKSKTGRRNRIASGNWLERTFVIRCIMEEEMLDGPMPDEIWNQMQTREGATKVLRATIRAIQLNIIKRLHDSRS